MHSDEKVPRSPRTFSLAILPLCVCKVPFPILPILSVVCSVDLSLLPRSEKVNGLVDAQKNSANGNPLKKYSNAVVLSPLSIKK